MKPLYLEGSRHTRVVLDDPALVVAREGEADRLFP
ncbi:MAG: DNA repair protein, partial [Gammaproteobacteria bacterium]